MRDNDATVSASTPISIGFDVSTAKPETKSQPVKSDTPAMSDAIIALTEKVFPRLPEAGGVILIGSLTVHDDSVSLATGFAQALQLIAAKSVLIVRFAAEDSLGKSNLTEVLRGEATLEEAVRSDTRTSLKTLQASMEAEEAGAMLMAPSFRDFLQNALHQFPWIILHYPALIHRETVISLISRSNAVIATMRQGEGRASDVQALRQLCTQLKTNFLGVALT
jgi:Mrp family chromosome partitioning ATPase